MSEELAPTSEKQEHHLLLVGLTVLILWWVYLSLGAKLLGVLISVVLWWGEMSHMS